MAMAMLGAVASTNVVALGLGEIELKSALNQPLNAEVALLSATGPELQELKVSVASAEAFANAGIDRPLFLNKLKFTVSNSAAGKPVVRITSRDAVREPFLDFLLEISWSKGRLVREYTVLVDPPVTMPAPAPVTQAPVAQTAAPGAGAPARRVTHTAQMPPVSVSPGEYGPTRRHDTLWSIAERVRPDSGVSVEQTMLGLLRANPEAFIDNNINNLKAGYVLRVPAREDLTSISRGEAARESRAQYAAWRAAHGQPPVTQADAGTAVDSTAVAAAPAVAAEPSLQLVAPDASEDLAGTAGGEALQSMQKDLMMANEALEEQRRQGEEMSGRLSVLEEQIANMQRLIQLKDNELARLQALSAGESPAESVPADGAASPAATEASPSAEDGAGASAGTPAEADATAVAPMEQGDAGAVEESPMAGPEEDAATAEGAPTMSGSEAPAGETAAAEGVAEDQVAAAGDAQTAADTVAEANPYKEVPAPAVEAPAVDAPAEEVPPMADTSTTPGFVDRLLGNPLWLGAGALVLGLLAFFGLRRRRGVETEFQESILQAAHKESSGSDSEMVASQPESSVSKTTDSSLLSEFAVSDVGSIRNDGEADPLAEADVYLAYGRYQQAEDLIKDALEKDDSRDDLHLKLLEVFMAGKNQAAFDEHAQSLLARLGNSNHPTWEKVAEMGRELNPGNPIYSGDAAPVAGGDEQSDDTHVNPRGDAQGAGDEDDQGLDFDIDLSFDPAADAERPDSVEFVPPAQDEQAFEPDVNIDAESERESGAVAGDDSPEFDLDQFDLGDADNAAEEEPQGDGKLADLDEVSTKLDLARAYIDMGDPDGARSILDEVMEEGSDNQKDEARDIMAQMS